MLRRHPTAALLALAALFLGVNAAALTLQLPGEVAHLDFRREAWFVATFAAASLISLAAMWLLFVRPPPDLPRLALPIVLATGLLARLLVIWQPPLNSDDMYRYVWDGRVQAHGINPYRYLPSDPALAPLRDPGTSPFAIYPHINRADYARTIYPPAAQLVFAATGLISSTIAAMRATMLLFDLITTAALLLILRAAARPLVQVVTWSWNPLVIWELVNGSHVDAIAVALTTLALLAAIRGRAAWAGLAIGLAVITKFIPAIFFPALWRLRQPVTRLWQLPLAALVTIAAGYACYASAGGYVLGFLGGYASEEGLESGSGFLALRLASLLAPLPAFATTAYLASAAVLLAALALWIALKPLPPDPPARAASVGTAAAILAAVFTALLSPHYPWYLTLLVVPAALTPKPTALCWTFPAFSVLWPSLVAPLLYLDFSLSRTWAAAIVYLPALPLLAIDLWCRRTS